jgi:ElaB/YqjD/DUF883 family membrane-anchored ribosome-binding protein
MAATPQQEVTTQKLVSDIKVLMGDSQELLKASVGLTNERIAALRPRIEESMRQLSTRLNEYQVVQRARETAQTTQQYVYDNPWKAVGISVLVGAVIGMLISRGDGE